MTQFTFNTSHHGENVVISDSDTFAYRKSGFCNGIVLSNKYILPGQLLLIEITDTQVGWSGNLRLGFTLLNDSSLTPLPTLSLPGLNLRGSSWIISLGNAAAVLLSEHHQRIFYPRQFLRHHENTSNELQTNYSPFIRSVLVTPTAELNEYQINSSLHTIHRPQFLLKPCPCCLHTSFGRIPLCSLIPKDRSFPLRALDMEKGSLIGVYYELEESADQNFYRLRIHLVINGVDLLTASELISFQPDQLEFKINENINPENEPTQKNEADQSMDYFKKSSSDLYKDDEISLIYDLKDREMDRKFDSDVSKTVMKPCFPRIFPRMRAVIDLYGHTRGVRVIQLNQNPVSLLKRLCICKIVNQLIFWLKNQRSSTMDTFNLDNSAFLEVSKIIDKLGIPPVECQLLLEQFYSFAINSTDYNKSNGFHSTNNDLQFANIF